MPVDQLRAELTFVFKGRLSEALKTQIEDFFPGQSADPEMCAAQTVLATMTKSLGLAVFARDRDQTVFHYLREDTRSLRIFIENLRTTNFQNQKEESKKFEEVINHEITQIKRFSKMNRYKMASIHVAVLINDTPDASAEQKSFKRRFSDIWMGTSNMSKAAAIIATGLAAFVFNADAATFGKALLSGMSAILLSTAFEAATAEAFKFHWS